MSGFTSPTDSVDKSPLQLIAETAARLELIEELLSSSIQQQQNGEATELAAAANLECTSLRSQLHDFLQHRENAAGEQSSHASGSKTPNSARMPPRPPLPPNNSSSNRPAPGGSKATLRTTQQQQQPVDNNSSPQTALSYGMALSASVYFTLESILCRCQAERLSLFLISNRSHALQNVANVGVGVPRPRRSAPPPPSTGVLNAVMASGIAMNLPIVNLEDVADCPGPTKGRSALIFPVHSLNDRRRRIGVLILINKRRDGDAFTVEDERILHLLCPSIAYVAQSYPLDYSLYSFDPAPLHRVLPHDPIGSPHSLLPAVWEAPTTQLVYHREGPEKFIRPQQIADDAEELPPEGPAEHLRSIAEYISTIESCWRESVLRCMEIDRQLKQKASQITDAQEILHRKQRKLDLLKDVLCEQLSKSYVSMEQGK